MAKKSLTTCMKCSIDNSCPSARCADCALSLEEPVKGINNQLVYCACLTIKDGDECPYYMEA